MYEKIKHYLSKIFGFTSKQDELTSEYFRVIKLIHQAKNFEQLSIAREQVLKFNKTVLLLNSPAWATDKAKVLESSWNVQYKLWKIRNY